MKLMNSLLPTMFLVVLLLIVSAYSNVEAATNVTFYNQTGVTLHVYYDLLIPGGSTKCWEREYGGTIGPKGRITFHVPESKLGFFNFRTCSYPCNSDCPSGFSKIHKDIDVTVTGLRDYSFTYALW